MDVHKRLHNYAGFSSAKALTIWNDVEDKRGFLTKKKETVSGDLAPGKANIEIRA
jgi:hypothetical protein